MEVRAAVQSGMPDTATQECAKHLLCCELGLHNAQLVQRTEQGRLTVVVEGEEEGTGAGSSSRLLSYDYAHNN